MPTVRYSQNRNTVMSKSKIHLQNLFPTPLIRVESFLSESELQPLINRAKKSHGNLNSRSDKLSHSQPISPNEDSQFSSISDKASDYLQDFGYLLFGENLNWTIKEMWMNVLEKGGHQTLHSHANSFISGVLYLTESHTSAKTIFHKSLGGQEFIFSNTHEKSNITPFNADRWTASDAKQGDLLLYPSSLLHAVPVNEGNQRITLAFNALPHRLKSWDYEVNFAPHKM